MDKSTSFMYYLKTAPFGSVFFKIFFIVKPICPLNLSLTFFL